MQDETLQSETSRRNPGIGDHFPGRCPGNAGTVTWGGSGTRRCSNRSGLKSSPGKELGGRTDAKEGQVYSYGSLSFQVGKAIILGEKQLAILDYGN